MGRDVLAQVVSDTRVSLIIGITAALATTLLGTLPGGLAGFVGGWAMAG
ncbi:hypothetical protein [Acidisphaera sp. L21]|nr:hypothetical protein [Acidisphaera sp. L21]